MKRTALLLALLLILFRGYADEGMWLPMLLGQKVYNDMVRKGLKLTKEQLYSINKPSIKDAVVLFGEGYTGAVVSDQGLIFTSYLPGYQVIAAVSHDRLRDGFFAHSGQEEIPAPGLSVQFLDSIIDVTKLVEDHLQGLSVSDRARKQQQVLDSINTAYSNPTAKVEARTSALFNGNQFIVFVYQSYSDIRLVGIPPQSVGTFGEEVDDFAWPRHTGDFSVFRVYADKTGKGAGYAPANVPLKPRYVLPISLKGIKEGDYAMIFGYPLNTDRYGTSYGVKLKTEIEDPSIAALREVQLKLMLERMKADPVALGKWGADYRSIDHSRKLYEGERLQLLKHNILAQKQSQESAFNAWAAGKPDYGDLLSRYGKSYAVWTPYAKSRVYLQEGILGSPLMRFCSSLAGVENDMVNGREAAAKVGIAAASKARLDFLKQEDVPGDMHILAAMVQMFYTDISKDQHPIGFYEGIKSQYGDLKEAATYQTFASAVFSNSFVFSDAKWKAFVANPDGNVLQEDPGYAAASAFLRSYISKFAFLYTQFNVAGDDLGRLYLKGMLLQNPAKAMYPDASQTMRVTYGNVKSYNPKVDVHYDFEATMKGLLEKYVPGDESFDLPAKLVELTTAKDYGAYKDVLKNDLVVTFITTNDITRGNAGSPVLNGKGELTGLSFDMNYESLDHDIAFDLAYDRAICVDIRYVLWCIDKVGGAPEIVKELTIAKSVPEQHK